MLAEVIPMEFRTFSHNHAEEVLETPRCRPIFTELANAIRGVSEADIISEFSGRLPSKSMSKAINSLLKVRLVELGWRAESPIFQDPEFREKRWMLDFAKEPISIEVAFNHGEAIAWNLLKPVLASQLNHVSKAIQTEVGVVICATGAMKFAGNFDSAVGEYEKFVRYFKPLQNVLAAPILLIGLEAPQSFRVVGRREGSHSIGSIEMIELL
jgi:hypothetical protein